MTSSDTASVRRSTIHRIPVYRKPFTPEPRRRTPRWLRRVLLVLCALLLLLMALVSCQEAQKPQSLATSTLTGPRLVTGPVCLEEAVDVSGSMDAFREQRERAEKEMFIFAGRVLTEGDMFSEAFFAGSGVVALPPSSLSTLTSAPGVPGGIEYTGTVLAPAVDALVAARTPRPCAARALVVITDGLLGDDQAALEAALSRGSYTRIFAVIPADTGWGRPAELSGGVLDSVSVHHFADSGLSGRLASIFADAKPLDVVFGEIIGSLTGQRLARMYTNN